MPQDATIGMPEDATIEQITSAIASLRQDILFGSGFENLSPLAEQHALKVLAYLDLAQRESALTGLHETRALADAQLGKR